MTTKSNENKQFLCDISSFHFTFSVLFLSPWDDPNCSHMVGISGLPPAPLGVTRLQGE